MKIHTRSLFQQSVFRFRNEKTQLGQFADRLLGAANGLFKSGKRELENVQKQIRNMSPENVLKRGYSITLLNGRAVKSFTDVKPGDTIRTDILKGQISSVVQSTHKSGKP